MAIYVPNVKGYFPDVQPFTPDYKFLSDILDKRTDKYESNYKALNNIYSQIVYSDLGREDTKEARAQFVDKLQPTIEKISGLDLSLAQNVNSAKAVFQPFYDNDLIIADMVQTKNINDIKRQVNNMRTSPKQEIRDKYYDQGLQFALYQYQDFLNASQENALREPMARYIENPQLYKRAKAYLDEKGYKIKLPPKFTKNGAYQILTTNGEDVTSRFLSEIREIFGNDPLVQDAYFADAYVQARSYAETGMQNGTFSNVTEGMAEWNKTNIESSRDKIALQYDNLSKDLEALDARKKKYDSYLKDHSFIPGSDDDIKYRNLINNIEGKSAQMELLHQSINEATDLLNSNDFERINNRGFNILFQSNIEHDLFKAADNYSFLTKEVEMKVDELYKEKYKSELLMNVESYKSRLRQNEERLKSRLRIEEKKAELELEGADVSFFSDLQNVTLDSGAVGIDDYGELTTDSSKINPINTQNRKIERLGTRMDETSAEAIIDITKALNSSVENPFAILDNHFVEVQGKKFSQMSETEIMAALVSKENRQKLSTYLDGLKEDINADPLNETNVKLMSIYDDAFKNIEQYKQTIEAYEKAKINNFSAAEEANDALRKMVEKGIPTILKKDANGNAVGIAETFEEYEDILLKSTDYVPTYKKRKHQEVIKENVLNKILQTGQYPEDFIIKKKIKKGNNIETTLRFNPKYFTQKFHKTPSYGMPNIQVDSKYNKKLDAQIENTNKILNVVAGDTKTSLSVLEKMHEDKSWQKKDFEKQIEILNNTFRETGFGDNDIYQKFDVNADLEGYTTTGDLLTPQGKSYFLRSFGKNENREQKRKLKEQYQELYNVIHSPYAEFSVADEGEEEGKTIKKIFQQAFSDLTGMQKQEMSKSVANIEYYPSIEEGKGGYKISFFDMIDPNSKDNYSWSGREFFVKIPSGVDNNVLKIDEFENYYIASKLKNSPQEKFSWDYYAGARIDVKRNNKNQVEYKMFYPYFDASTGNMELISYVPEINAIPYTEYKQNDLLFDEYQKQLYNVVATQLAIKKAAEKAQHEKNKSNKNK